MKNIVRVMGCAVISMLLTVGSVRAAEMNDYCVVPPFIQEIAKPNLLMIIDNSASMNDLAYDDTGYSCSTTKSKSCTANTDCPSGETCTQLRNPSYCYDSSFRSANTYVGYFDHTKNYQYNFSTSRFQEVASIPASCSMAAVDDHVYCKLISNTLHLNIDKTDSTATKYFYASGKLLNWLTTSKFDVEKQVLTGGKYVTKVCSNDASKACVADSNCGTGNTCSVSVSAFLQPESRGCVGMGYVKNLNAADFVNYATGAANPNTALGLTILVKGPQNPNNPVSPSTGGQTYLEFYTKTGATYDYKACQDAVTAIATSAGSGPVASAVDNCLASSGTTQGQCQQNTSLGCLASYGPTTPNCDFPVKTPNPYCQSDTSRSCAVATQATDCTIIGASTCTAGKPAGTACSVSDDCDFKGCSLLTTRSCTATSDCVKAERGYCSLKATKNCSNDADCGGGFGTCLDKPYDYGTCGIVTEGVCAASGGDLYVGPCKTDPSGYLGPCVLTAQQSETKTKTSFTHSMQACWALRKNATPIGHDEYISVRNECSDIYGNYKTCSNDRFQTCSVNGDCGAGNTCLTGPQAIQPGNPGLICSNSFEGLLFAKDAVSEAWVLRSSLPAATPAACLSTDTMEECGKKIHTDFCNQMDTSPVTDPTNPPSTVVETENLPAILSGIGVEAQLGKPIFNAIPVKIETATVPTGLVQEFANKIRIGLMSFNSYGSASETSTTEPLPVGKLTPTTVCSNDSTKVCTQSTDCGTGNTCVTATDLDGAKILSLVGKGHCSNSIGTACTKSAHCTSPGECLTSYCSTTKTTTCTQDANCPSGETCLNYAGSHTTSGLVSNIDLLGGATWTPFAEAFYNAIGYYAIDSSDSTGKTSRHDDMRINNDDYPNAMNPSEYVCQANNILLVTDGSSTADQNSSKTSLVNVYKSASGNVTGTCTKYAGSQDLDDLAWLGRQRNINSLSTSALSTTVPRKKNEQITTYVVFNGSDNGESGDCKNTTLLTKTANNGGTSLLKTDIPDQYQATLRRAFESVAGGTASGTAASILSNSEGSGANILQAVFYPTKDFETVSGSIIPTSASWIGEMQNLWYYVDPYIGNSSVREDTNKDNALHIVNDYVTEFQFKGGETIATIKKDTDGNGSGDANAIDPRVINQGYCTNTSNLSISSYSKCANDSGCVSPETCSVQGIVNADDVNSLWRAGKQLWNRDLTSSPRKLYTYLYGTSVTAPAFCGSGTLTFSANAMVDLVTLKYLNSSDNTWTLLSADDKCIIYSLLQAGNTDQADDILRFTQGYEPPGTRPRTVNIARKNPDGTKQYDAMGKVVSDPNVWKLGDIIASTPRVQSFNKLNNFHQNAPVGYGDMTYADDTTGKGFANSTTYKARGMAYAGANDGMLHAFKLGSLAVSGSKVVTPAGTDVTVNITGQTKAALGGTGLGEEQWAFVPKNVLPYLKYLADPEYNSKHLYLVDGPTKLIDASIGYNDNIYIPAAIRSVYTTAGCDATGSGDHTKYWACKKDPATESNKSWRTILIGSMGIGGASNDLGASCSTCVKTPVSGVGYSSYFALDITDPEAPKYLWEFSDPLMGFATSGVAVARVRHDFIDTTTTPDTTYKDTNGRWFAVIGNGPSGPINTESHQFKGKSRNPLRVFVLDLKTGVLLKRFLDSSKDRSFVGQMSSAPIDTDRSKSLSDGYYSDDALYFGYTDCTNNCSATDENPTWDGGIMRLLTNENVDPAGPVDNTTSNWSLSTLVSGLGPVTTAVGKLQDRRNHKLWLYTGSGRYFYKGDVSASAGKILGIKEPCYSTVNDDIYSLSAINGQAVATRCTNSISFGTGTDFADQSDGANLNTVDNKKGWFIPLEGEDTTNHYGAERIITEPVTTPNGAVFFTSFMPSTDICNYGGNSYMWGMRYDTGGAANTNQLQGKALVQVSTGAFEEINLSTALSAKDGRKMANPMVGKPPTDPPPIVSASGNKPLKRILHIQEK